MKIFKGDLPDDLEIKGEVAIDTEAMGLKPHRDRLCLVQMATQDQRVFAVQFVDDKFKAPNLVRILNDPKILKIFHYARFDVTTMTHYLKDLQIKNIFCTKIASYLARTYTDRHGLKNLVKELLNIEMDKTAQTSYWGADTLTEKQKEYAASDVLHLCRLKEILVKRLKREERYELALDCFKFLPTQAKVDLLFAEETDIFAYQLGKNN
ncbi:MAG: ribonuclease H-like domain-containing protein [Alphaproteobacteria bacterium]|nr:MAG: ribonuclease H-like domain-containing protein [Alphaproteobacteria bacterium]